MQNIHSREQWLMDGKKEARKRGRPNLVDNEMLKKIKDGIIGSCLASTIISQKNSCN